MCFGSEKISIVVMILNSIVVRVFKMGLRSFLDVDCILRVVVKMSEIVIMVRRYLFIFVSEWCIMFLVLFVVLKGSSKMVCVLISNM